MKKRYIISSAIVLSLIGFKICSAAIVGYLPNGQAVYNVNSAGCGPFNGQARQDFITQNNLDIKTPTFTCDPVPPVVGLRYADRSSIAKILSTPRKVATTTISTPTPIPQPTIRESLTPEKVTNATESPVTKIAQPNPVTEQEITNLNQSQSNLEKNQKALTKVVIVNGIAIIILGLALIRLVKTLYD